MSLPNGNYVITNAVGSPVGIESPVPPVQPVVRVGYPDAWFVNHLGGDHYLLDISGSVTVAQGNHVLSNRFPGVKGTTWVIKQYEPGRYTIIDTNPGGHNGWTLYPGPASPQVSLEPVPPTNVKAPQLWLFRHIPPLEEEGEN